VIIVLAALLTFRPFDDGLPRTGQWRHGFAVADMNNDGRPDLAFSSPRKQFGPPVIFLNLGGGRWTRWSTKFPDLPFDYGAVAAADFDGNGTNDLALAVHYRGVTVMMGDGQGTFTAAGEGMAYPTSPSVSAPFSSRAVVTADWNRDGRPDVIALSDGPRPGTSGVQLGVTVFENLGGAWKPLRAQGSDGVHGDALATGDIDGDGLPDVVTASALVNYRRLVRFGFDATLQGREIATAESPALVQAVDLHDFDRDGREEAVLAYTTATAPTRHVIELVSFPEGSRPPRELWSEPGGGSIAAVAAGDLDGDGNADVVAARADGRIFTFRGDGHGFVTQDATLEPPSWRLGCAPFAVRVADLNGDRRDEVIATFAGESRCTSGGGVEVWTVGSALKRRAVRR
jgi:FG-GAP-like repeat/FG-GAP repeat